MSCPWAATLDQTAENEASRFSNKKQGCHRAGGGNLEMSCGPSDLDKNPGN